MVNEIKKIIASFIDENFKKEANIILFGSICNNSRIEGSDIDVLIISKTASVFIKEFFNFRGFIFDVIIIPEIDIYECIEKDKYLKVYCDIFLNGVIYKQKNNFISNLKNSILSGEMSKDVFLREKHLDYKISFFYSKFFNCESIYDAEMFLNELSENIILRRLLDFGVCNILSTKHLLRSINLYDKDLLEDLFNIKKTLFLSQNQDSIKKELDVKVNFKSFSNSQMFSNQYVLNYFQEDELVIYFKSDLFIFSQIINYLKVNNYAYYIFSIDKNNIHVSGIYLVLKAKNKVFIESIIPKINDLIDNTQYGFDDYNMIFPYQLDIKRYLGMERDFNSNSVDKFFIQASKFCEKMNQKEDKIKKILFFLIGILMHSKKNKKELSDNIIFLRNSFMAKAHNKNNFFSYNQSELGQNLLRLKFKNTFDGNSNLNLLLEGIISKWSLDSIIDEEISILIENFNSQCKFVFDEKSSVQYSILNMILNIFSISDFHKAYIFYTIASILNKQNEF